VDGEDDPVSRVAFEVGDGPGVGGGHGGGLPRVIITHNSGISYS